MDTRDDGGSSTSIGSRPTRPSWPQRSWCSTLGIYNVPTNRHPGTTVRRGVRGGSGGVRVRPGSLVGVPGPCFSWSTDLQARVRVGQGVSTDRTPSTTVSTSQSTQTVSGRGPPWTKSYGPYGSTCGTSGQYQHTDWNGTTKPRRSVGTVHSQGGRGHEGKGNSRDRVDRRYEERRHGPRFGPQRLSFYCGKT